MIRIELLSNPGCPHVAKARQLLSACLDEVKLDVRVEEQVGAFPSPTIRIDGRDVMGAPANSGASCRLDLPTRDRILAALDAATG